MGCTDLPSRPRGVGLWHTPTCDIPQMCPTSPPQERGLRERSPLFTPHGVPVIRDQPCARGYRVTKRQNVLACSHVAKPQEPLWKDGQLPRQAKEAKTSPPFPKVNAPTAPAPCSPWASPLDIRTSSPRGGRHSPASCVSRGTTAPHPPGWSSNAPNKTGKELKPLNARFQDVEGNGRCECTCHVSPVCLLGRRRGQGSEGCLDTLCSPQGCDRDQTGPGTRRAPAGRGTPIPPAPVSPHLSVAHPPLTTPTGHELAHPGWGPVF